MIEKKPDEICPHDCDENGYIEKLEKGCRCLSCLEYHPCPIHRPGEVFKSIHQSVVELNQSKVRVAKSKRILTEENK